MKTAIILAVLLGLSFTPMAAADPGDTLWTRTYGGSGVDGGYSVQQTSDGGYIIAGYTDSFGAGLQDFYLVKTDSSGDTLWTRTYGGSDHDWARSVQQTSDGGYIIAGYTGSFGAGGNDFYLVKTDSSGDTLWTRTYGGSDHDQGLSVQQTSDGGYVIGGMTESFGAGDWDVYLVKTDSSGDTLWTRNYGGSSEDHGYSVQQTSDGGYIIAGLTGSFGAGEFDVYLVKTNSSGDILWARVYGGSDSDYGVSVQQTFDGGYIVAGETRSFGAGYDDVYLVRSGPSGDTLWTRTYGGIDYDHGRSVQQTSDGGYIVAGQTRSFGAGNYNVWLLKTDSSGDTLWTRTYGGSGSDWGWSVQQTSDGGYIIAGGTSSFGAGGADVYLIKTVGEVVAVDGPESEIPVPAFASLSQCYPNPFNASTVIEYGLPQTSEVKLEVHNLLGEKVATLVHEKQEAGYKSITWEASEVSSGVYFYKLTAGDFSESRRMMLVK
ncbi:MAG: T9SS type A sorting domain-containing protein [Candidatus Zixiibacteriota bacterium]